MGDRTLPEISLLPHVGHSGHTANAINTSAVGFCTDIGRLAET